MSVPNYIGIYPTISKYPFTDKNTAVNNYIRYMLNRSRRMFEYANLPDTITERNLEIMLQSNGNVFVTEVNGDLYSFTGGYGGAPDAYYLPTIYTVSNSALNFTETLNIGNDGILMWNDTTQTGMLPLYSKYATLLAENDITINRAIINMRTSATITAPNDAVKKEAEIYLEQIEAGKSGVIADQPFLDGIKVQPTMTAAGANYLSQLIEMQQYIKATWLNEIGLNSNYNMKREALNSAESELNKESLLPLVDDMLKCRKIAVEDINTKYGTKITVNLGMAWKQREEITEFSPRGEIDTTEAPTGETENE